MKSAYEVFVTREQTAFSGSDTVDSLLWPLHVYVDRSYVCPPDGLVLVGWFFDPYRQVSSIKLCAGEASVELDPTRWVRIKRKDVVDAIAGQYDVPNYMLGYMAYAAGLYSPTAPLYLEVETVAGERVFRPFKASLRMGITAIKEILSEFEVNHNNMERSFSDVLGPAVASINNFRISSGPGVDRINFGAPLLSPRASVIVPLYGRMDFLEYQLAFFEESVAKDDEIIYVLDDPPRRTELIELARSSFARFDRPFSLLLLDRNVGFAPANNVGLSHARGSFVCFLNSDVFPDAPDWFERMIHLARDPSVGIVGARLIYEDGTLQHGGCTLEALPDLGNWLFPMHPGKGAAKNIDAAIEEVEMVTGACMVMRTNLARDMGGFDEGYVIGDFEDADLCKRVAARGLRVLIEQRAQLFHLERQSQNLSSSWRFNLTLYNAWRFNQRWGTALHG